MMAGRRIEIRGTVQGVGFRPWVYRLAQRTGIAGRVRNDSRGVTIDAFGDEASLDGFIQQLEIDVPASARITGLESVALRHEDVSGFVIESSSGSGDKALSIPPDLSTCAECEAEVHDASNRRYRYAFTNCTTCGPRFTIAEGIPYDRAATTMSSFEMCAACQEEYDDVDDRRFHAQPNACRDCGPSLELVTLVDASRLDGDPLSATAELLMNGAVVAIKGLGGFHLACDAQDSAAVRRLRARKHRDEKPFAVMVGDLAGARALAELSPAEEALLASPERPIVLARAKAETGLAVEVSPGTPLLGLFLPYTPLHHLLVKAVGRPLVMTSANVSEEPICRDNEEARRRLDGIADAILIHDRAIAMRCDDSVARVIAGTPTIMRRSRGFVPRPFALAGPVAEPVLACGGHLKNTFCIAIGDRAYFGPHIGDLETVAALEFFEEAIERMETILSVRPKRIAHDRHPGYLSTRYAMARKDATLVGVQHHHAHVVSLMAEHQVRGPVLGVAYDGTGFGDDGTSWGGEFLLCFQGRFERLATFRPIRLPGGNLAIREVWRVAYALIHDAFDGDPPIGSLRLFDQVPEESLRIVSQMIERDLNAPRARGVGRYFDAFGALALRRPLSTYEGQVAIALDHAADDSVRDSYAFALDRSQAPLEVDLRPAVREAVSDLSSGLSPGVVSARFHNTLSRLTTELTGSLLAEVGHMPVALTGGVFQNDRLVTDIIEKMPSEINMLRHREVPPGDGGIALGQALIADAFLGDKG